MVQSINTKALLTLASVVRRPYLASPHVNVTNISEINFPLLKARCGIRAIVFDKDNTLTAPYNTSVHAKAELGLRSALETFGRDHVAILSNSAGTRDDPGYEDALRIERDMGIAVIRHDEKKPGGLRELMDHFTTSAATTSTLASSSSVAGAEEDNGEVCGEGDATGAVDDPSQICMIGDRLLTDVVFGNLYGMLTVHTLPLCSGSDNAADNTVARVIRGVENTALYGNWFGGRMVRTRTLPHAVWPGEDECPLTIVEPPPSTGNMM